MKLSSTEGCRGLSITWLGAALLYMCQHPAPTPISAMPTDNPWPACLKPACLQPPYYLLYTSAPPDCTNRLTPPHPCVHLPLTPAAPSLLQVRGSFSFVIFDQAQHRVFAARDAEGSQPLYWGATGAPGVLHAACLWLRNTWICIAVCHCICTDTMPAM